MAIAGICVSGAALLFVPIVVALMLPAFAAARTQARASVAMTNLRQLHLATFMYSDQWGDVMPPSDTWPEALELYLDGDSDRLLRSPHNPGAGRAYAMNVVIAGRSLAGGRDLEQTVLFFEAEFGSPPSGGPELLPATPRGGHGYVIVFVDGHVTIVPKHEVGDLIWDPDYE